MTHLTTLVPAGIGEVNARAVDPRLSGGQILILDQGREAGHVGRGRARAAREPRMDRAVKGVTVGRERDSGRRDHVDPRQGARVGDPVDDRGRTAARGCIADELAVAVVDIAGVGAGVEAADRDRLDRVGRGPDLAARRRQVVGVARTGDHEHPVVIGVLGLLFEGVYRVRIARVSERDREVDDVADERRLGEVDHRVDAGRPRWGASIVPRHAIFREHHRPHLESLHTARRLSVSPIWNGRSSRSEDLELRRRVEASCMTATRVPRGKRARQRGQQSHLEMGRAAVPTTTALLVSRRAKWPHRNACHADAQKLSGSGLANSEEGPPRSTAAGIARSAADTAAGARLVAGRQALRRR